MVQFTNMSSGILSTLSVQNGFSKPDDHNNNSSSSNSVFTNYSTTALSGFGVTAAAGGNSTSFQSHVQSSQQSLNQAIQNHTMHGKVSAQVMHNSVQTAKTTNTTTSSQDADNAVTNTTISLDAQKSDFGGKMTSFSKNGITVTFEDPDHSDHTPGTMTWIDTGKAAPGFGIGGNGNKGPDTGAEMVTVTLEEAADLLEISLVDHGTKNSDDSVTFKIFQESGDITEVTLTLDSNAPEKVTTFSFEAADYGDGSAITQAEFYSTSNLGGGHGEASFLIGGVEAVNYGDAPLPDPDPAPVPTPDPVDDPVFIVANNVDDVASSDVNYIVGEGNGVITGGNNADILVGDAGGAYTMNPPPVDFNVVMMLDVSGSMYSTMSDGRTRLDHLVDAVENLLTDMNGYNNGQIDVHLVPFDTTAWGMATYTITDDAQFADALTHLQSLTPGGVTNYESALQTGIDWLESGSAIDGAITTSYFVSDGYPNYAIDDATGNYMQAPQWTWDGTTYVQDGFTAMEEIQGLDGSNEIAQIQSLSDEVIGVGINIGSSITNLDQIDSDGAALNITSPEELSQAFADSNPLNKLDPIGDDVINGGDGTDLIFGDALYTDDLAVLHNLGTEAGAGWEVFDLLESGNSALDPFWNRTDTLDYLMNNGEEMMQESIDQEGEKRIIGSDTLNGGGGDDYIFGQEGDDMITGGEGADTLYGGRGADTFLFEALSDAGDTIKDFSLTEGDSLDVSQLLAGAGYDPLQDSIDQFLFMSEAGGNTAVSVDVSGVGDTANAVTIATLEGVTGLTVNDMVISDALIA